MKNSRERSLFVFRGVGFKDPMMCERLDLKLLQGTVCSGDRFLPRWSVGLSIGKSNLESPGGCSSRDVDCDPCA